MKKIEFIKILKEHASKASLFGGRFVSIYENNEDHWVYVRPAVDTLEPSIDLSTEGFVLYSPNLVFGENQTEKISYEDFITKYNLIKK